MLGGVKVVPANEPADTDTEPTLLEIVAVALSQTAAGAIIVGSSLTTIVIMFEAGSSQSEPLSVRIHLY